MLSSCICRISYETFLLNQTAMPKQFGFQQQLKGEKKKPSRPEKGYALIEWGTWPKQLKSLPRLRKGSRPGQNKRKPSLGQSSKQGKPSLGQASGPRSPEPKRPPQAPNRTADTRGHQGRPEAQSEPAQNNQSTSGETREASKENKQKQRTPGRPAKPSRALQNT